MKPGQEIICKEDYLVKTLPDDYTIKKGEKCIFVGYLMGETVTLSYKDKNFVVFEYFGQYFE